MAAQRACNQNPSDFWGGYRVLGSLHWNFSSPPTHFRSINSIQLPHRRLGPQDRQMNDVPGLGKCARASKTISEDLMSGVFIVRTPILLTNNWRLYRICVKKTIYIRPAINDRKKTMQFMAHQLSSLR
jgi:hypothetical protein